MVTYTTLEGAVLDLSQLPSAQREFFQRAVAAYRDGMDWVAFTQLTGSAGCPASGGPSPTRRTLLRAAPPDPAWHARWVLAVMAPRADAGQCWPQD
jgi:hypothetical protein